MSLISSVFILRTKHWHACITSDPSHHEFRKIHLEDAPRVGGLAILTGMWLSTILIDEPFKPILLLVLLSALPAFLGGLLEDIFKSVSPALRLLATLLSGLLVWSSLGLTNLSAVWFVPDQHLLVGLSSLLLATLFITVVSQGANLLDGFHGLCGVSSILMLALLAYLAVKLGDRFILAACALGIFSTLGFLVFNWPFGKIFLGDGGAYLLGFFVSTLALLLFARRSQQISLLSVFMICWLPSLEVIFSAMRRLLVSRTSIHPRGSVAPASSSLRSFIKPNIPGLSAHGSVRRCSVLSTLLGGDYVLRSHKSSQ